MSPAIMAISRNYKKQRLESLNALRETRRKDFSRTFTAIAALRKKYFDSTANIFNDLDKIDVKLSAYLLKKSPGDKKRDEQMAFSIRIEELSSAELIDFERDLLVLDSCGEELARVFLDAKVEINPNHSESSMERVLRNSATTSLNRALLRRDIREIHSIVAKFRLSGTTSLNKESSIDAKILHAILDIAEINGAISWIRATYVDPKVIDAGCGPEKFEGFIPVLRDSLLDQLAFAEYSLEHANEIDEILSSSEGTGFVGAFRPEGLIHRTDKGDRVRSKSEVVIANLLHGMGLEYVYESPLKGTFRDGIKRPDFLFNTSTGLAVIWEHLGMMQDDSYKKNWQAKLQWYEANGYRVGASLFVTLDDENGGIDSGEIRKTAETIRAILQSYEKD